MSANQLHRTLGVTLKTAWFLGHRIREAMREGDVAGHALTICKPVARNPEFDLRRPPEPKCNAREVE